MASVETEITGELPEASFTTPTTQETAGNSSDEGIQAEFQVLPGSEEHGNPNLSPEVPKSPVQHVTSASAASGSAHSQPLDPVEGAVHITPQNPMSVIGDDKQMPQPSSPKAEQNADAGKRKRATPQGDASISELPAAGDFLDSHTGSETLVDGNLRKRRKSEDGQAVHGDEVTSTESAHAEASNSDVTAPEASITAADSTTDSIAWVNTDTDGPLKNRVAAEEVGFEGVPQPTPAENYTAFYPAPTDAERASWKGFIELDSECNTWNIITQKLGVKGIELIDVACLPDYPEVNGKFGPPVYGIIFCFDINEVYEVDTQECPEHVWFSNQINANSCGTIALLNVLNNILDANLGTELSTLKERTDDMTPTDRGYAVAACNFVRAAHNSFARKIDMLEADFMLQTEYEESLKNKRKRRPAINIGNSGPPKRKKAKKDGKMDLMNKRYHFIAYVPIGGEIWRLDGMDAEPAIVGVYNEEECEDWMQILKPTLLKMLIESPTSGFNVMALVPDGWLEDRRRRLAANIKLLKAVDGQLDTLSPDWRDSLLAEEKAGVITGPNDFPKITAEMIEEAEMDEEDFEALEGDLDDLFLYRQSVVKAQNAYVTAILTEMSHQEAAARKAADRETDYGPTIHNWVGMLSANEVLRDIAEAITARK